MNELTLFQRFWKTLTGQYKYEDITEKRYEYYLVAPDGTFCVYLYTDYEKNPEYLQFIKVISATGVQSLQSFQGIISKKWLETRDATLIASYDVVVSQKKIYL